MEMKESKTLALKQTFKRRPKEHKTGKRTQFTQNLINISLTKSFFQSVESNVFTICFKVRVLFLLFPSLISCFLM